VGFEGVKPIVEQTNPELAKTLTTRFADLQTLLDAQKTDTGFTFYDDLTPDEVQDLANAVNALSEPLSQLTAAVLS
jgi:iron uptake system component EfeO